MFMDMLHIQMQLMQRPDQWNEYVCMYICMFYVCMYVCIYLVCTHVSFSLSRIMMSGLWLGMVLLVCTC